MTWRLLAAALALSFISSKLTTCRSPGDAGKGPGAGAEPGAIVELSGIDTGELTAREKRDWSSLVSDLLAPCADQPVSLAQCVNESRPCRSCAPAAKLLVRLVQRGKTRAQVEKAYRLRFGPDQVQQIALGDSPAKGPADAPVTIVEWADFECPACAGSAPLLDQLLDKHPRTLRLVFKNYPLSIHEHAEKAARAGLAAHKQGKFWELYGLMFEATRKDVKLVPSTIERLAKKSGLDMKRFAADFASEEIADAVARDRKQGDAVDLKGTPLIYINGRHFDFAYFDLRDDLEPWVLLEAELAGKPAAAGARVARPDAAPPASAAGSAPPVNVPAPQPAATGMAKEK
jgi:protein-disulfide isomerase